MWLELSILLLLSCALFFLYAYHIKRSQEREIKTLLSIAEALTKKKALPPELRGAGQVLRLKDLLSLSNHSIHRIEMVWHLAIPDNVPHDDFMHFLNARAHAMIISASEQSFAASKEVSINVGTFTDSEETTKH